MEYKFRSTSKEETRSLGTYLAPLFKAGDVVLLKGDLGAGKTTLVGGVAVGLKVKEDVLSPTFNIMKCYFKGSLPLYHIDAYRLEHQNIELGLDEFIEGNGVCFVEWPQYIAPLLPSEVLSISLTNAGDDNRDIVLTSNNKHYDEIVKKVEEKFHD
jgi:tRNA threonylcarbamoyladenosine biosynthesis protein TsaE